MDTLGELRAEHEEVVIGPKLHNALERIVRATTHEYPASEYSRAGTWNREAQEDLLQDWVEKRLLGRGDLGVILNKYSTLPAVRRALTTSLSQLIINQRRRSSAANLHKRIRKMLETEPSFQFISGGWTHVADAHNEPMQLSLSELTAIAFELSDDDLQVVRYGPTSLKSSPILRESKLREFLVHVLGRIQGSIPLADLMDVFRMRFNLHALDDVELDERTPQREPGPDAEAQAALLVRMVYRRLTSTERHLARAYYGAAEDLAEAAKASGATEETIFEAIRKAIEIISDWVESADEAEHLMRLLSESLFEEE